MAQTGHPIDGERLAELRHSRSLTQAELAEKVDCAKRTIEKAERGASISLTIARRISVLLGVDVNELLMVPRWGGATSYFQRKRQAKSFPLLQAVATKVATTTEYGAAIAVSSGVTVALAAAELARLGHHPLLITNNVGVIDELNKAPSTASVTFTGGEYVPWIHACVGKSAVEAFKAIRIPLALLGISAVTPDGNVFVLHHDDVLVYESILTAVTDEIVVACDVSKCACERVFPIGNLFDWCKRTRVRLVTNPPSALSDSDEDGAMMAKAVNTLDALRKGFSPRGEIVLAE